MPVINYHTINGRIRGETTSGVRTNYLTDALGSVTATVQAAAVVNTYRYNPYGALLAKTGNGVDPDFRHAGTSGSRPTGLRFAEQYNQRRHLSSVLGMWTTVDPLWPGEAAYLFALANPTTFVDPQGLTAEWARIWSSQVGTGVKATVKLPDACFLPSNSNILFYAGVGTIVEGGASISKDKNGKCAWGIFLNAGRGRFKSKPAKLGPGMSVEITIWIAGKVCYATINGVPLEVPCDGGRGQAKTNFSTTWWPPAPPTAHSNSVWAKFPQIQLVERGPFVKWSSAVHKVNDLVGGYTVDQPYPLGVHLRDPGIWRCDCPTPVKDDIGL